MSIRSVGLQVERQFEHTSSSRRWMDGSRTYKSEKGQDRTEQSYPVHGHNHLVVSATFTTVDAELQLPDTDDYVPRNTSWQGCYTHGSSSFPWKILPYDLPNLIS